MPEHTPYKISGTGFICTQEPSRVVAEVIDYPGSELLLIRANSHDRLVEALRDSINTLDIGLQLVYSKEDRDKVVRCIVCNREWPLIIRADRTAGAAIDHDQESICGIMHETLKENMALLAEIEKGGDHA